MNTNARARSSYFVAIIEIAAVIAATVWPVATFFNLVTKTSFALLGKYLRSSMKLAGA